MTSFELAWVAVGALTRVAVAALAQEHVRSLDLEYERRRTFVTDLWLIGQLALMILGRRDHVDLAHIETPTDDADGSTPGTLAS